MSDNPYVSPETPEFTRDSEFPKTPSECRGFEDFKSQHPENVNRDWRIYFSAWTHSMSWFIVSDDGQPDRNADGSWDIDLEHAEVVAQGYLKWDGCCEVTMDSVHCCGLQHVRLLVEQLHSVYELGSRRIPSWQGDD